MAASKESQSIFPTIFSEGLRSPWLPVVYFLNAFLTPFLLPAEKLEAGYTMHHWDLITALSGTFLLILFRFLNKNPDRIYLGFAFFISGVAAALTPYLWAEVVLPHGIPGELDNKWIYAFSGPVAQIVGFALLVGAGRYTRKTSNSVAESRAALNVLRRDIKDQIERERNQIVELILTTVKPAIVKVETGIFSGADRGEVSKEINSIIEEVVRPLSHEIDASAAHIDYEVNQKRIKRDFRKKRVRTSLKSFMPLHLALSAPLSLFSYINFNLATIAYLHGFGEALEVSAPFLLFSSLLFIAWKKFVKDRRARLSHVILVSIVISFVQGLSFAASIFLFSPGNLSEQAPSFALTTFAFTLIPALFGMGLFNLRANLEREERITSEIAENISVIRRELWSLRKKFAREIHGGLQSKLQILSLKFERDGGDRIQLVESINTELASLLSPESDKPRIENFKVFISELIEFWDGIVSISAEIKTETYELISTDYLLAECLHEVIREAVNNAVKHSGASQISIRLETTKLSTLALSVENNVSKEIKAPSQSNLGTSIYKELAHTWALELHPDRVNFNATFILNQHP